MLGYIFGLLCGIAIGVSVMCLMTTSKKADKMIRRFFEQELQEEDSIEKR